MIVTGEHGDLLDEKMVLLDKGGVSVELDDVGVDDETHVLLDLLACDDVVDEDTDVELFGLLDEDVGVLEEKLDDAVDVKLGLLEVHAVLYDIVYELVDEEVSHSGLVHVLGHVHDFECHSLEVEITFLGLSSSQSESVEDLPRPITGGPPCLYC